MANLNLGNVAIVPKGIWNATQTYEKLNTVTYNGSSYIATKPVSAGILPTNTSYWQMIASKGDKGEIGNTGSAATATVGSTSTGAAGTNAVVTNSSSDPTNAVFDFTIPQGVKGDAATISVGKVTTGAPNSAASVINTGTTSDAVFDFTIPEGKQGVQGIQGLPGLDLTVAQALTVEQQAQARANIGAISIAQAVVAARQRLA